MKPTKKTNFHPAPAAKQIARNLIDKHHGALQRAGVRIEFLFTSQERKANCGVIKVTSLAAYYGREEEAESLQPFFVVAIYRQHWDRLTADQQEAYIDHRLCHCGVKHDRVGNVTLQVLPHDVQDFAAVISRHGCYRPDLEAASKAFASAQTALEMD